MTNKFLLLGLGMFILSLLLPLGTQEDFKESIITNFLKPMENPGYLIFLLIPLGVLLFTTIVFVFTIFNEKPNRVFTVIGVITVLFTLLWTLSVIRTIYINRESCITLGVLSHQECPTHPSLSNLGFGSYLLLLSTASLLIGYIIQFNRILNRR